jgi:hypothetical protein
MMIEAKEEYGGQGEEHLLNSCCFFPTKTHLLDHVASFLLPPLFLTYRRLVQNDLFLFTCRRLVQK